MATTEEAVRAFFESYRMAFEGLEPEILAAHFAYPVHLAGDSGQGDVTLSVVPDKAAWVAQLTQLTQMYRAIGVWSIHMRALVTRELSPRLVQAAVTWALIDDAAEDLYVFEVFYTLAHSEGTLRVAALAHDELPKLRAAFIKARARRQG